MKRANGKGKTGRAVEYPQSARREFVRPDETFADSDALAGLPLPDLAQELPTMLLTVHATFTAQHVINELRYQWETGNLSRGDRAQIAQLGKEIAEEITKEH